MDNKVCMVCTTPFNIICSINTVIRKELVADLYIDNEFNNCMEIAEEIRKEGLFENVYCIDTDKFYKEQFHKRVRQRIMLLGAYRKVDLIAESILGSNR